MGEDAVQAIRKSITEAERIQVELLNGKMQADDCFHGQLLTAYHSTLDKAASTVRKINSQLHNMLQEYSAKEE